jgi:hypothetical protein
MIDVYEALSKWYWEEKIEFVEEEFAMEQCGLSCT